MTSDIHMNEHVDALGEALDRKARLPENSIDARVNVHHDALTLHMDARLPEMYAYALSTRPLFYDLNCRARCRARHRVPRILRGSMDWETVRVLPSTSTTMLASLTKFAGLEVHALDCLVIDCDEYIELEPSAVCVHTARLRETERMRCCFSERRFDVL